MGPQNLYQNKINESCSISRRYLNVTNDQSSPRYGAVAGLALRAGHWFRAGLIFDDLQAFDTVETRATRVLSRLLTTGASFFDQFIFFAGKFLFCDNFET